MITTTKNEVFINMSHIKNVISMVEKSVAFTNTKSWHAYCKHLN